MPDFNDMIDKERYSYGKPVCKSCMGETYYRKKPVK